MKPWTVDQSTPGYRMNGRRVVPADARLAAMKFYHVSHAPSGSDGRYYADMFIALDTHYCDAADAWVRQALLLIAGPPMVFTMGVSPQESYAIRKVDLERWLNRRTDRGVNRSYDRPTTALFLSDGPPIDGWPTPARLEDLQSIEALRARMENPTIYGGYRMAYEYVRHNP